MRKNTAIISENYAVVQIDSLILPFALFYWSYSPQGLHYEALILACFLYNTLKTEMVNAVMPIIRRNHRLSPPYQLHHYELTRPGAMRLTCT